MVWGVLGWFGVFPRTVLPPFILPHSLTKDEQLSDTGELQIASITRKMPRMLTPEQCIKASMFASF